MMTEVAKRKGIEYLVFVNLVPNAETTGKTKIVAMVKKGKKLDIKVKTTETPDIMPKKAMFWDGVSLSFIFIILIIL